MATTDINRPLPLTDTQRAILTAAAARPDATVILPAKLKGSAARTLTQALLKKTLVREVRAKGNQTVWRKDEDTGRSFSLILTEAGKALGGEPTEDAQPQAVPAAGAETDASLAPPAPGGHAPSATSSPTVPRSGTKLAGVIALLGRTEGTSVPEVMATMGWLPHTTRAVLTGLRKRGYALTRTAGANGYVYRIDIAPAAGA